MALLALLAEVRLLPARLLAELLRHELLQAGELGRHAELLCGTAVLGGEAALFFLSSRRRHTRWTGDWSSDVCSSDLAVFHAIGAPAGHQTAAVGSVAQA